MKRLLLPLLSAILLSSCNSVFYPSPMGDVNAKEFLSKMDGPEVPTLDKTMLSSGEEQEKNGDYKAAAQLYRQVLERSPENAAYAFKLAEAQRHAGQFDEAIGIYDKLLAKDQKNIEAKESKGLSLLAKGEENKAGELLAEIYKKDPTRWRTLNGLGILYASEQRLDDARQFFARAVDKSPNNPVPLNNLGLSFALEKDYDQASEKLRDASGLAASGTYMRKRVDMNLALVYGAQGKLNQAEALARKYLSGSALNNNMGLYAHMSQDDELAKTYFNMALTENKTYYERAWRNLDAISGTSSNTTSSKAGAKRLTIAAPSSTSASTQPSWMNMIDAPTASTAASAPKAAPVSPVEITPPSKTPEAAKQAEEPVKETKPVVLEEESNSNINSSATVTKQTSAPAEETESHPAPAHSTPPTSSNGFEAMGNWVTNVFK